MNALKGNLFIFLAFVSSLFIFSACDSITVIEKDKWIGDPCTCYATVTDKNGNITKEGDVGGCQAMDLVPLPTGGQGTLKGCENVEPIEGAEQVCLRYYAGTENNGEVVVLGPKTLFNGGFCALSAVGCEPITPGGDFVCGFAEYGDADKMVACPAGTTMIEGKFVINIMTFDVKITNKTCAPNCHSDADCRTAEGYSCIAEQGTSFCYSRDNLDTFTAGYTLTAF